MTRRAAMAAAAVAALIAGGAPQIANLPFFESMVAGWLGVSTPAALATEDWPICTTMAAMGSDPDRAELDPDFVAGKRALMTEDWRGAIGAFEFALLRDPSNADIQNYIGYAYWRLRQSGPAMSHFQQALEYNPRHRRAREHLGELNLALGDPVKAEEQLVKLKEVCLLPCEEVPELERAISAYTVAARSVETVEAP